jgi:hypothetical protein
MTTFVPVHPASGNLGRSIPGVIESENPLLRRGEGAKENKRNKRYFFHIHFKKLFMEWSRPSSSLEKNKRGRYFSEPKLLGYKYFSNVDKDS